MFQAKRKPLIGGFVVRHFPIILFFAYFLGHFCQFGGHHENCPENHDSDGGDLQTAKHQKKYPDQDRGCGYCRVKIFHRLPKQSALLPAHCAGDTRAVTEMHDYPDRYPDTKCDYGQDQVQQMRCLWTNVKGLFFAFAASTHDLIGRHSAPFSDDYLAVIFSIASSRLRTASRAGIGSCAQRRAMFRDSSEIP